MTAKQELDVGWLGFVVYGVAIASGALERLGERGLVTACNVLQVIEKGRSELKISS